MMRRATMFSIPGQSLQYEEILNDPHCSITEKKIQYNKDMLAYQVYLEWEDYNENENYGEEE